MTLVTPDDGKGCCPTCGQPTSLKVISAEVQSALDAAVAAERARCAGWHDEQATVLLASAKRHFNDGMPVPAHQCEGRAVWHRASAAAIRSGKAAGE